MNRSRSGAPADFRLMILAGVLLWTALVCRLPLTAAEPDAGSPEPATEQRVFDEAGLFTDAELDALEARIDELRASTSMDLVILTIDDAAGKTAREYADDYYDEGGFGVGQNASGALFLIDLDNRETYLSTCGAAIERINDAAVERILDNVYRRLSDGDFYKAADAFLDGAARYLAPASPSGGSAGGPMSEKQLLICLCGSALVTFLFCSGVRRSYRGPNESKLPPQKQHRVSFRLTQSDDEFLGRHTTSRHIEPPPPPTRSSTHLSAGGRTHGGGGVRFSGGASRHTARSGRSHGGGGRRF